ncbi:hypothetical protein JZ751_002400 [Albula glossodonta]|uniref:Uncharacterized protein n=1 Tax=Albula glossodonta TaxID=121402 RepID=A0A8T2MQ03_9TELE|nr:hypothetical protein JZ751_002400 [Albula glossodonta]
MGCGLRRLRRSEESSPGKIYSTLRRPQVETKVGVAYTYRFLDFLLGNAELECEAGISGRHVRKCGRARFLAVFSRQSIAGILSPPSSSSWSQRSGRFSRKYFFIMTACENMQQLSNCVGKHRLRKRVAQGERETDTVFLRKRFESFAVMKLPSVTSEKNTL